MRRLLPALVLLATTAAAQFPLQRMPGRHIEAADFFFSSELADVDGDGDLDLLGVGSEDAILLNDGSGRFAQTLRLGGYSFHGAARAGDFDGDGTTDVLFTSWRNSRGFTQPPVRLYRGVGGGRFASFTAWPGAIWASDCAIGDLDGDNDDDAVFANWAGPPSLGLTRNGYLPPVLPTLRTVAAADIDGDSDLDIVFGNQAGPDILLWNDGNARFWIDATGALPQTNAQTLDVAFGDLNGDGNVDLVTCSTGSTNEVFLGVGGGRFRDVTATHSPDPGDDTNAMTLVDYDGDGDLDWLWANSSLPDRLWINDGTGHFTEGTPPVLRSLRVLSSQCLAGDVDRDGDADLLWDGGATFRLLLQDPSRNLVDATRRRFESKFSRSRDVDVGDLDGDGTADAFVAYRRSAGQWFRGDTTGRFTATTGNLPQLQTDGTSAALGDVDGDGDLDILLGTESGHVVRLFQNSGTGTFADVTTASLPRVWLPRVQDVVLGDVDSDGDLDAVLGNGQNFANALWRNDGNGRFVDATAQAFPSVPGGDTRRLAIGDVDGDGDDDLFFAEFNGQDRLLLNNGAGAFTDATGTSLPAAATTSEDAVLIDLDGDLDLDLFVTGGGYAWLYQNDGGGVFADQTTGRIPTNSTGQVVTSGDFDGDGTTDLLIGNRNALTPVLLANDGTGSFVRTTPPFGPLVGIDANRLVTVDPDLDGDPDVIYVSENELYEAQDRMLVNRTRQAHTPYLARTGRPLEIEWHATWSATGGDPLLLPWFATTLARTPLSLGGLGTLFLDPQTGITGPVFTVPRATTVRRVIIQIPSNRTLIGVTLYHQALFVHGPSVTDWHLSNLLAAKVVD